MGPVTVFFNTHIYVNSKHDMIVIVGSRPHERFQSRFGCSFENLGFKSHQDDVYKDWEAFRSLYCKWSENWEIYRRVWFNTLVLFPDCEINLSNVSLTGKTYTW